MALTEVVDQSQYPWRAVVYIESTFPGGSIFTGSGVMVGANDVLTAAHVVYDPVLGAATSVKVTPAYDPSPLEKPYGSVFASYIHYFPDFDPDGDGLIVDGNGGPGLVGAELDIALIDLATALGNQTGWMALDPNFGSGTVNITGHPGFYQNNMMNGSAYAQEDVYGDYLFYFDGIDIHPGHSGGPVWFMAADGPHVIGVVSTSEYGPDVYGTYDTLTGWINGNNNLIPTTPTPPPSQNLYLTGTAGPDVLAGGQYHDYLVGLGGNDQLTGGAGSDSIAGGLGDDLLIGNAGSDTLRGGPGFDDVRGGQESDFLYGGENGDILRAALGNDRLFGGPGLDLLQGGQGDDVFAAGKGNDTIYGGRDEDTMTGGEGADRFVFTTEIGSGQVDTITDFQPGVDKILLSAAIFVSTSQAFIPINYNQATGALYYNPPADDVLGDANVLFAYLTPGTVIQYPSDFAFVA
jgi:Ca2+-binding RTX toxin-like protein